jgi:hypothetical protein
MQMVRRPVSASPGSYGLSSRIPFWRFASTVHTRTQAADQLSSGQSYLSNESPSWPNRNIAKPLLLRPDDARYLECLALIHQVQVYQPQGTLNLTRSNSPKRAIVQRFGRRMPHHLS